LNQHVYLRLRLALSLALRRQIFVVVCDDLLLRDELSSQLQADLANNAVQWGAELGVNLPSVSQPRLVTLQLDLNHAHVLTQIQQHRESDLKSRLATGFQVIGVEELTRQPSHVQRSFLDSLVAIARQLPESNLLLWVTRPWCRTIQQSVPEFWQVHTAVFEFEGDPAPVGQRTLKIEQSAPAEVVADSVPDPIVVHRPAPASKLTARRKSLLNPELAELIAQVVREEVGYRPDHVDGSADLDPTHPSLQAMWVLQELESLDSAQASPEEIATLYRELGDWYRDRLDQSHPSPQYLKIVIRCYEQVIKLIDPKSPQLPDILNDIANLYWLMSRNSDPVANLEKALKAYWFALDRTDPSEHPETYAMIQNNLGSVYSDLAHHEKPVEHLECAIAAYRACLQYRSGETESSRYAATQNNLGTAFWNLAQHQQPMDNLQTAIAAYNEALRHYDPEREPLHYAMIQNNLGTAYWNLSQCDAAVQQLAMAEDFLLLAIGAYRVALIYRTLDAAPMGYAATQNNLGTAYWHLAQQPTTHYEDRQSYLVCAIEAYQEALAAVQHIHTAAPYTSINFDLAATHHNVGAAYYEVATDDRIELEPAARSSFLHMALQNQVSAWQSWQSKPDFAQSAVVSIIQAVRTIHDCEGIQGQTQALSSIPPSLIATVMKEL
jgi:tetratricopeptide (TPR) repeat protein